MEELRRNRSALQASFGAQTPCEPFSPSGGVLGEDDRKIQPVRRLRRPVYPFKR